MRWQEMSLASPAVEFTASTFSPAYAFISPNRDDDGHDTSASAADTWLSGELPQIMATPRYQAGTMAIFVTWDESNVNDTQGTTTPPDNHVYTAVVSPARACAAMVAPCAFAMASCS